MSRELQKSWSFHEQLKVGERGQELFIQYYHQPLVVYPDRKADFQVVNTGELLELKSDTYNMQKTVNFFFERWSDVHRVSRYVYMFVRHNHYFEFDNIKLLCKELDKLTKKQGLIYVKNRGYVTAGYTVPREKVKHLYEEYIFNVTA
jgi:hypothetical protein